MTKAIKTFSLGEAVLSVVFENDNFMVIEKPAGILVYSPDKSRNVEITMVDILRKKNKLFSVGTRDGVVHRLDRGTSGLVIFAKNKKTEISFKEYFSKRMIEKQYTALVRGKMEPQKGVINIPLGRGSKDRLRVVPKKSGRESVTSYEVAEYFPKSDFSLLRVGLKTGRTHQIRVHFSAIGHPIIGDEKYSKKITELKRQFLHADFLSFLEPFTGEKLKFKSSLPEDLNKYLVNLRIKENE